MNVYILDAITNALLRQLTTVKVCASTAYQLDQQVFILKVPSSNLDLGLSILTEVSCGVPKYLQANTRIILQ
jgi:hypothetical protein